MATVKAGERVVNNNNNNPYFPIIYGNNTPYFQNPMGIIIFIGIIVMIYQSFGDSFMLGGYGSGWAISYWLRDNMDLSWETSHGEFKLDVETINWILLNCKKSMYNEKRSYIYNKAYYEAFLNPENNLIPIIEPIEIFNNINTLNNKLDFILGISHLIWG